MKLVQIGMDFFSSGSVGQSAVGIIEKGADIYVNLSGMMVTGFIHHCKREGLSSNPGVTLVFFSAQHPHIQNHIRSGHIQSSIFYQGSSASLEKEQTTKIFNLEKF